jgi:hypothetical protein
VCNNNVGVLESNSEESETSGNKEDISADQCNGMCGCERMAFTMRTVKMVVLRNVGIL